MTVPTPYDVPATTEGLAEYLRRPGTDRADAYHVMRRRIGARRADALWNDAVDALRPAHPMAANIAEYHHALCLAIAAVDKASRALDALRSDDAPGRCLDYVELPMGGHMRHLLTAAESALAGTQALDRAPYAG